MAVEIDATALEMYHVETGEVKMYSELPDDEDFDNWIVRNTEQVIAAGDEIQHDSIEISEAD